MQLFRGSCPPGVHPRGLQGTQHGSKTHAGAGAGVPDHSVLTCDVEMIAHTTMCSRPPAQELVVGGGAPILAYQLTLYGFIFY